MLGHSPIFSSTGSHGVQHRLFYIHSTAIPFPVRPYPVPIQSYFERVERDRILNIFDVLDHHPVLAHPDTIVFGVYYVHSILTVSPRINVHALISENRMF